MIYFIIKADEMDEYDELEYEKIPTKDGSKAVVRFRTSKEIAELKANDN